MRFYITVCKLADFLFWLAMAKVDRFYKMVIVCLLGDNGFLKAKQNTIRGLRVSRVIRLGTQEVSRSRHRVEWQCKTMLARLGTPSLALPKGGRCID